MILDGDDASVITIDGRSKVSNDKYGLEFPWRPRSLLSLVPKPLRRYVRTQLQSLGSRVHDLLVGVMQSFAPSHAVKYLRTVVLPRVWSFVRMQVSALLSGRGGGAEGGGADKGAVVSSPDDEANRDYA